MKNDAFDILNIFNEQASSSELGAGVHERVRLITIDPKDVKITMVTLLRNSCFLNSRSSTRCRYRKKDVSFFLVDLPRNLL
jgi:hypothetical protein